MVLPAFAPKEDRPDAAATFQEYNRDFPVYPHPGEEFEEGSQDSFTKRLA